jgi:hypothetical protein
MTRITRDTVRVQGMGAEHNRGRVQRSERCHVFLTAGEPETSCDRSLPAHATKNGTEC